MKTKKNIKQSFDKGAKSYENNCDIQRLICHQLVNFFLERKGKISSFKGISGLANKESSRAHEMKKILSQVGIKSVLNKDTMKIYGNGSINAKNKKIFVKDLGDHRVAMCAFILAILTNAKTKIKNFETVFTSSPSFLKIMKTLGAKFEIQK